MKNLKIFAFLFLLIFPLFSYSQEFLVEVENNKSFFTINMRTFKDQAFWGVIKLLKVDIEKATFSQDGIIDLYVKVDIYENSARYIAPYKGSFTFKKGDKIPEGRYSLYINDEDYGFLYILKDNIYFDPTNCL